MSLKKLWKGKLLIAGTTITIIVIIGDWKMHVSNPAKCWTSLSNATNTSVKQLCKCLNDKDKFKLKAGNSMSKIKLLIVFWFNPLILITASLYNPLRFHSNFQTFKVVVEEVEFSAFFISPQCVIALNVFLILLFTTLIFYFVVVVHIREPQDRH